MKIRTTIKDVARQAGVSVSTVSLVVNNKASVSEALRERVLEAVRCLNYRPNAVARSLKSKASKVLGLIIPDIVNPFFPLMVRGVEDEAKRHGYSVLLCNTDGKVEEEAGYLDLLEEKRVDGIVFTPSGRLKENLARFEESPIPKVILDRRLEDLSMPTVTVDNLKGAYLAVTHLLRRGRRKVLFISGPTELQPSSDRLTGYQRAFEENGFACQSDLVSYGDFSFESGMQAVRDALRRGVVFDAIFAANDLMALGAMVVLAEESLRVPGDIEVVGYDDILLASLFTPALTTVKQPAYEMGREAVRMILRTIHSKKGSAVSKVFEPELVVRQSSPGR